MKGRGGSRICEKGGGAENPNSSMPRPKITKIGPKKGGLRPIRPPLGSAPEGSPFSLGQCARPALKFFIAMAAVHDCGFDLVDHPPHSSNLALSIFCSPTWKTFGWETVSDWWRIISAIIIEDFLVFRIRIRACMPHAQGRLIQANQLCWKRLLLLKAKS